MVFSKKLFIMVIALITTASVSVCSEQPMPFLTAGQQHVLGASFTIMGPCILARSVKNLFIAKKLEDLITKPALTLAIQNEAYSLRKRGLIGIVGGSALSIPFIAGVYVSYQMRDKIQTMTFKLPQ
jgi:hypothetical protein